MAMVQSGELSADQALARVRELKVNAHAPCHESAAASSNWSPGLADLYLLSGVVSEPEILLARELSLLDGQSLKLLLAQLGYTDQPTEAFAERLLSAVNDGKLSMTNAQTLFKEVVEHDEVERSDALIAEAIASRTAVSSSGDSRSTTSTRNLAVEQTKMVLAFCKENRVNYQNGLHAFGWAPLALDQEGSYFG